MGSEFALLKLSAVSVLDPDDLGRIFLSVLRDRLFGADTALAYELLL